MRASFFNIRSKRVLTFFSVILLFSMVLTSCNTPSPVEKPQENVEENATEREEEESPTQPPIKIGVISILEGSFAGLGEQGTQGAKLALLEAGGKLSGLNALDTVTGAMVAGRPIELHIESSDGTPDKATEAARKLVELIKVDILIGPLSGSEGLAIKEYAKSHPETTFLSGAVSSQNVTLRDPAQNFFRFNTDAVQMAAGLGKYAYDELGYKKVVTIGEDYSFPFDQVGAFVLEYCQAGGTILERIWVPIGTTDYAASITRIPEDTEAIVAILSGSDVVNFIKALDNSSLAGTPILGGSVTVDASMIESLGKRAEGIVSASAVVVLSSPEYKAYVDLLKQTFTSSPGMGLNDVFYYINTKSALLALEKVGADLSDNHSAFRNALSSLSWNTPLGEVKLDENHHAIATTYISKVIDGQKQIVKINQDVSQTMGMPLIEYLDLGEFDRENPKCINP